MPANTPPTERSGPIDPNVKDPIDELVKIIHSWKLKARRRALPLPDIIPRNERDAAMWWVTMQEPFDERFEKARFRPLVGKGKQVIDFPYINRLCFTFRIFLNMPTPKQEYVVQVKELGYWWRGEHEDVWSEKDGKKLWYFELVMREYEKQRDMGPEEYRKDAVARMRAMTTVGGKLPYDKDRSLSGEPLPAPRGPELDEPEEEWTPGA